MGVPDTKEFLSKDLVTLEVVCHLCFENRELPHTIV